MDGMAAFVGTFLLRERERERERESERERERERELAYYRYTHY